MMAQRIVTSYSRALAQNGESVTLRRPGSPDTDATVKAFVSDFAPHELVGDIRQGDKKAVIGNTEIATAVWPSPILRGDKLIVRGKTYTIQSVDTLVIGTVTVRHNLVIRG